MQTPSSMDNWFLKAFRWPEEVCKHVLELVNCSGHQCDCSHKTSPEYDRVRILLASNPHTSPDILDHISKSCIAPKILERVAANPTAREDTLRQLAIHSDAEVRIAVCENLNTNAETLIKLSADTNSDVRFRLAESYHIPAQILDNLAEDENPYVAARARTTKRRLESSARAPEELPAQNKATRNTFRKNA